MKILVTGVAGFIGFHLASELLNKGHDVIGLDNLNNYYSIALKESRLAALKDSYKNKFTFERLDLADRNIIDDFAKSYDEITHIVHLAAQAGVRYSIKNPHAYLDSNLAGHLNILEICRRLPNLEHLVYASSSSVYGSNSKLPFSVDDPVEHPISLYAATKRSCELMSHTYSHLYKIPSTGLRFFTVYGPWGRPDMSAFIFTKAIFAGEPIEVFNNGDMRRNFTYISDVVAGTSNCLFQSPVIKMKLSDLVCHKVYNIGNNRSEKLMDFINTLENLIGKKANIKFLPMQAGDVKETVADIVATTKDFNFKPEINIQQGLENFILWFKEYYKVT